MGITAYGCGIHLDHATVQIQLLHSAVGELGAVTGDEIVRRSGVAKTTLYRHFGSTTALVFGAVGDSVHRDATRHRNATW